MKVQEITSAKNATFTVFKDVLTSKGIVDHGRALIFGKKAVGDILAAARKNSSDRSPKIASLIVSQDFQLPENPLDVSIFRLKRDLFETLDIFGTKSPIAFVGVPEFSPWDPNKAEEGCYLYLPFQDPSNVGAALRSAAAFGVSGVLLQKGVAHPFHPRSSRAASGGLFLNQYFHLPSGLSESSRFPVYGLDKSGEDLSQMKFPKSFILVPGVEGPGLQKQIPLTHKIGITMRPEIESLNAAVATGIVLYRWAALRK